jgi:hypothetical protein
MFEMDPEMDFGERLSLWWSCFWRQMLAMAALITVFMVGIFAFGQPTKWAALVHQHDPELFGEAAFVGLIYWLASLPLNGEATRRGFLAQKLTAPPHFDFGRIFMLGLTTFGWGVLASIPVSAVSSPLRILGHPLAFLLANLCLHVLATMYIVLPRQARRLRLQSGYAE